MNWSQLGGWRLYFGEKWSFVDVCVRDRERVEEEFFIFFDKVGNLFKEESFGLASRH